MPRKASEPRANAQSVKSVSRAAAVDTAAHDVEQRIGIDKEPGVVFRMLSDAGLLCRWLIRSGVFEPHAQGHFRFELGGGLVIEGAVQTFDAGRGLTLTWERDESVSFRLERTAHDSMILSLTHRGFSGGTAPARSLAAERFWAAHLTNLKSILSGGGDLRETKVDRNRVDGFILGVGRG
jgi:uncharacterized protein YndB with AHSA1/START domain